MSYYVLIPRKIAVQAHTIMHTNNLPHHAPEMDTISYGEHSVDNTTNGVEFRIDLAPEKLALILRQQLGNNIQIMKRTGCWPFYGWVNI